MGEQLQLATLEWGERGPRALLIHGLTSSARSWWRLGAEMARAGYRVDAPDLRGHGDSPRGTDYLLASYATDVLALNRKWDVVVGHSLGGAIAAIAQTTDRSFADRLVLEDPLLRLSEPESFIAEYTKPFEDPSAGAVLAQYPRWHPQDARIKAEALEASSSEVVRRTALENQPWDVVPMAMELDCPTLLIAADPDENALVTPEMGEGIAAANPHVTFRVLAGAGHSPHRDSYGAFWQVLHGHLST
ncbi:MAG TPA: alpha/beta fold hydrolase [Actinomycetota bacterium]|nr:alpha/beta fold hydrolase [Actinomycetota bacterium]